MFNLFSVRVSNGYVIKLNSSPLTHDEACAMKSKLTPHVFRQIELREISA